VGVGYHVVQTSQQVGREHKRELRKSPELSWRFRENVPMEIKQFYLDDTVGSNQNQPLAAVRGGYFCKTRR
jgi:hypothetical protein